MQMAKDKGSRVPKIPIMGGGVMKRTAFAKSRYSGIRTFRSARLQGQNPLAALLRCSRMVPGGLGLWDGDRRSLHWNAATLAAFPVGGGGAVCQLQLAVCNGLAQERDHVYQWSLVQLGLPRYTYCTGACHYSGVFHADADAEYNNIANLQWSCQPCNGSKNGPRGNDGNIPRYEGDCPGPIARSELETGS